MNVLLSILAGALGIVCIIAGPVLTFLLLKNFFRWIKYSLDIDESLISIPLLLLNAVPAAILFYLSAWAELPEDDLGIWLILFTVSMLATIVISIIRLQAKGILVGIIRACVGALAGMLFMVTVLVLLAFILICCVGGGSPRTIRVRNRYTGSTMELESNDGTWYTDRRTGRRYRDDGYGYLEDDYGNTFSID